MTWLAVTTLMGLVAVTLGIVQTIARVKMEHGVIEERLRSLAAKAAPPALETPIPTALQDWDAEYERLTGETVCQNPELAAFWNEMLATKRLP